MSEPRGDVRLAYAPREPEPEGDESDPSWDPFAPDEFAADAEGADWSWFTDPPWGTPR